MDIDVRVAEWLNGVGRSDAVRPVVVWAANELALVVVAMAAGLGALLRRVGFRWPWSRRED